VCYIEVLDRFKRKASHIVQGSDGFSVARRAVARKSTVQTYIPARQRRIA
jgi:hypothetical protein